MTTLSRFRLPCGAAAVAILASALSAAAQTPPAGAPAVRFLNPPTIAQPRGYTHVVEVTGPGRIIYVAGQLGYDVSGKVPEPGDFRAPGDAGVRKSQGRARQRRRPASSMWSSSTPFSPTSARRFRSIARCATVT